MKRSLILSAALTTMLFKGFISCASKQEEVKKEIGLQLYSIRDEIQKDLGASLDSVAAAGYNFVELASYNPQEGTFYGMEPEAFAAFCKEKGLNVVSSHINGPDPNATPLEECLAWWDKAIADHVKLGVSYIVQPSMWQSAYESVEGLANYCNLFNLVGEKCNAAGIRFGYHNHAHEFTTVFDGVVMYDYMLTNTSPEKVFFQIDVYWSQVGGASAVEYMEKYPGRFELWHVKDDKEIGASGKIDFNALYQKAEISGMKYAIVEQEAFDLAPFASIKASYDYLNNAPYVKVSFRLPKP